MSEPKASSPRQRYLLRGCLTTATPLHIGSGTPIHREGLRHPETGKPIEVNAVMVDHRSKPYLPATTLKGALRAWCRDVPQELQGTVDDLFGTEATAKGSVGDGDGGLGGAAEFHDALAVEVSRQAAGWRDVSSSPDDDVDADPDEGSEVPVPPDAAPATPLRWASEGRWTEVAPRVAKDRVTGTASHRRLFYDEYVPAGVRFEVRIAARTDAAGVALLLAALQAFGSGPMQSGDRHIVLGADRVNGWGKLSWELTEIRHLDAEGVRRWLALEDPPSGWKALEPLAATERDALVAAASELAVSPSRAFLELTLRLEFEGLFLVNDPSQTGEGETLPNHAARIDAEGRPVLPATSFRGALRSQAERILRTIVGNHAACGPGAPRPPCDPPANLDEVEGLCPACRLFGAAGWRSPIEISEFAVRAEGDHPGHALTQELLAIDRFTGGGAPGLKFSARGFVDPRLSGTLRLDLEALARSGGEVWMLGLLALVLRDVVEGDVPFGFGAAKGFGQATATVVGHRRPEWADIPPALRQQSDWFEEEEFFRDGASDRILDPEKGLGMALHELIDGLESLELQPATVGGVR